MVLTPETGFWAATKGVPCCGRDLSEGSRSSPWRLYWSILVIHRPKRF